MLHTAKHPANPAWNCCVTEPAHIGIYSDGSAGVICARDAHHFTSDPDKDLGPLPEGWKPETTQELWQRLVEDVREAHMTVACDDTYQNAYDTSQAAFLAAIKVAYPTYDTNVIHNLWLDNNESIAYQVGLIDGGTLDLNRWGFKS